MRGPSEPTAPAIAIEQALSVLAPAGLLAGCHQIGIGDERFLLPAENASIATRQDSARAASGAGRRIAHELMRRLGCADVTVLRGVHGSPVWPAGIVGSIAHDDDMAVAIVGRAGKVQSVGIDIEPALPLPAELMSVVLSPRDRLGNERDPGLSGRVLFAVKEAVYKASFPLDGRVLGFEDIAVDLESGEAVTVSGRTFTVRFAIAPKILALAY